VRGALGRHNSSCGLSDPFNNSVRDQPYLQVNPVEDSASGVSVSRFGCP
jgi:hypothetical protein